MKNIKIASISLVISSLLLATVDANAKNRYSNRSVEYAYATVLSAEPLVKVFRVSEPQRQCYEKQVTVAQPQRASRTNRLLGTFIGAAIGNAIGHKKSNKRVGVYAGALLGGAIADDMSRQSSQLSTQWVTQCETVSVQSQQQRIIGYRVTYLFDGETYTTRLKRDPGNSLRVRISVTPVID